ncbi:hypothetical protein BY996DRAFT_2583613 [Phakopsora pachyrhizi]|nr:hypothetical protein BY996DRAFT_2583613 [Phakopsora pachyrhizi]
MFDKLFSCPCGFILLMGFCKLTGLLLNKGLPVCKVICRRMFEGNTFSYSTAAAQKFSDTISFPHIYAFLGGNFFIFITFLFLNLFYFCFMQFICRPLKRSAIDFNEKGIKKCILLIIVQKQWFFS